MSTLGALAMPVLRRLDPERAHSLALRALRMTLLVPPRADDDPRLSVAAFGRVLTNPVGLAAGFDKDAVALRGLARLGFGFLEAGTVTLRPQPGNPKPRQFRLPQDRAAINRMGFNGRGIDHFAARLTNGGFVVPIGANLGLNKDGAAPARDYAALARAVAPHVAYIAINVSSPNTPGLRDLQAAEHFSDILGAIHANVPSCPPLFVKLAPDLADAALPPLVEACVIGGAKGVIVSNTTIARPAILRSPHRTQAGGLSGAPLFAPATAMLSRVARLAGGRLTLIGVGGIFTGRDVLTKLRAGATLVQVYTAFAYEGPALLPRLKRELLTALQEDGFATVTEAVGADLR